MRTQPSPPLFAVMIVSVLTSGARLPVGTSASDAHSHGTRQSKTTALSMQGKNVQTKRIGFYLA